LTEIIAATGTARAVSILLAGGTVAIPTETVYGLAAVCDDTAAVSRVYSAKNRPTGHPLIIHVDSPGMAARYGELDPVALRLIDCFWPGPLTVLVPRRDTVPDVVTGGRDTVAIRMPAHAAALEIISACGRGLVAPSANRFGHVSPTTAAHVLEDLDGLIDAVVDGGPCNVGLESTIVDCSDELQVLRAGAVTEADIADCTGVTPAGASGPERAPGMLASHYSPDARLVLCADEAACSAEQAALSLRGEKVCVIGPGLRTEEYASRLYALMRDAERSGADVIVALVPATDGLGAAVRDRLTRAAGLG
jgi:L-threonylcarbamoyladenylate synthase